MGINFIKTLSNIAKSLGRVFFNGKEYGTLIANGKTLIRPNYYYSLSEDGSCYTVEKMYDEESVVIPSTHLGIPVTEIDGWQDCKFIDRVNIEGDSIIVERDAFKDSSISEFNVLAEGNMGRGRILVSDYSFENCRNLCEVNAEIISLGQGSFRNCSAISSIILGNTYIPNDCFEGCSSLSTVFFLGTDSDWDRLLIIQSSVPDVIKNADIYFYSEDIPEFGDLYGHWHYNVNGEPIIWNHDCLEGHSYEKIVTNPTCTEKGRTTAVCSVCNHYYTTYFASAKGHRYGELKVVIPPTCTRRGIKRKTCTTCGAFVDVYTDAFGHDLSKGWEIVIPPTETTKGEVVRKCQNAGCDYHENKQVTLGEWIYINEFIFEEIDGGWEISANGELVGDITIPSSYLDIPVIRIKSKGFANQKQITGVSIPDSIVSIGAKAFYSCFNLRYLIMGVGVTTIEDNMVSGSNNLSCIYYKGTKEQKVSISTQGTNATLLTLPWFYYSETKPEESGLYWYYNIYHWYDCPAIMWGDTDNFEKVERITGSGVYYVRLKEGVTLSGTVALPPILDGKRIYGLADDAFYRNYTKQAKLNRVIIPNSYQRIGDRAFAYCYKMGTLHVPKSIAYVGQGAFAFTNSKYYHLVIYFAHNEHEQGAWSTKWNEYTSPSQMRWSKTFTSDYTTSSLDDGTYAVAGTNTLFEEDDILIADSHGGTDITAISDYGFMGATASSIAIGSNISSIGKLAFSGTKCQIVKIPLNITTIKPLAFSNCDNLTIYCEAESKPEGWAADWCDHTPKVVWGYTECEGDHSYETVVIPPTCTEQGYTTYTCSLCGESYVGDYVQANGHNYGEWTITLEPTCTETGTRRRDCSRCDAYETEVVSALGHVWKAATCTAPKTCSVCGATEGEALGHDYDSVVTPPTCTEKGYTTHTCSRCGDTYTNNETNALGHDYKVTKNVGQNCIKDGYILYTCSRCGDTYTEVIPADGVHSYSATVVAPTCTEQGYTEYICDDCGTTYKDNYTEALGHTWGAWKEITPAECEIEGQEERTCSVCGEVETRVIPALGHDYDSVVTPPTCGDGGYTLHTCSRCGHSYYDNYTDPTGLHNWGDWTIDLEPTCTSEGSKTCTCKDCGTLESASIPMTPHIGGDWIIDKQPTTEEEGSKHQECTVCGYKFPTISIPKLEDTNTYLVTESGEYLTDEQGNLLIL